jgi:hypothetical protein
MDCCSVNVVVNGGGRMSLFIIWLGESVVG